MLHFSLFITYIMAVLYVLYTVYWYVYNSLICVYSDLVKCMYLSLSLTADGKEGC